MTSQSHTPSPTQELIKRLTNEMKLKQTEISEKTGIPQPRISRWAAGEVAAGADDALKLQALVNEYDKRSKKRRTTDRRKR